MAAPTPEVLADPLPVVIDLVAGSEPSLSRESIEAVVVAVAGGRAKRRRLAQALQEHPSLLRDGRSPAPAVVGDLLIALRNAGACNIAAPVCADCGKALGCLQRRGQDWYCGACGPKPEPCADCGKLRPVCVRDRQQRPHCVACRPKVDQDPTKTLLGIVAELEPDLASESITRAVLAAAPRTGQRQRLAWALQDDPELLTGAGARAPVPAVLRLIDGLVRAGAHVITRPACPHCGRVLALVKPRDGVRLCRNCVAKSRAQTCSRCGVHREAATRDQDGRPLCPYCMVTDPANQETCISCRRRRAVSVRTPDGPLCNTCRPAKTMTCSICGRSAPGEISTITGKPWCHACQQRRTRCTGCGKVRLLRGGTLTEPLCATCTRPASFWHTCPGCGEHTQHRTRRCGRCSLRQRLGELLADHTEGIHPQLQALYDNLANQDHPKTVLSWLNKDVAAAVLHELASGQRALTHAGLDELPDSKPIRHLRAVLIATGALPPRDEHLVRLERWITATIAGHHQKQMLHHYGVWHATRRLRRRNKGQHATHGQVLCIQRNIKAAIALLDWLNAHGLDLATARQGDLDTWLTSDHRTGRREAGNFVRWAKTQNLTSLDFAATRWDGPSGIIDAEARWGQARHLLHDDTIKPEDRVAGLLVLLYAQTPATISRLTLQDVQAKWDERAVTPRTRTHRPTRTTGLTHPAARRVPPRTQRTGRPRNLVVAVPRRAARPSAQRLPAWRTPPTARTAPRPSPLDGTVPARHRTSRSPARPNARNSHRRRRRLATRQQRRLDRIRRHLQPPPTTHRRAHQTRSHGSPLRGIRTVAISDSASTCGSRREEPDAARRARRSPARPAGW